MMTLKLRNSEKLIILGLTLLAFWLRVYRLDFQSYWIDEAWTVHFANLPLVDLWRLLRTEEIHPPFYFPSINIWRQILNDSEFALRYYSLVFSVLAIPLIYRLGKDLGDGRLGLIAALLMTVAPFQIWHAQEARMYAVLTAASTLSMWGFVNFAQRGGWRWWLVYLLGTTWTITTHYHGFVVMGSQGLFLLLTWRRYWRSYPVWAGTLALIFLLYAPWLVQSGAFLRNYIGWLEQPALLTTYVRSATAFSLGQLVPLPQAYLMTLIFVLTYGLGLIYASQRHWGVWRGSEMLAFILSYTLAPNVAAWLFGELRQTSVYLERYLIPVQVGYLLAVAIGVLALFDGLPAMLRWIAEKIERRRGVRPTGLTTVKISTRIPALVAVVLLLALVSINVWVLRHHYFDRNFAKPDWRAVIRTIENHSLPGDAVILTGDGGEKLFDYYYRGDLPVYDLFNTPVPSPAEARQQLADIASHQQRLWYTPYGVEIDGTLEQWLAENAFPAWQSWLGRKRLALYDTRAPTRQVESVTVSFADSSGRGPTLTQVILPDGPVAAGDLLPLILVWQTDIPLAADYQVSLRLVNKRGDTFAQSDWPPLAAGGSTSAWSPGQLVTDHRSLWIPPDAPPGSYWLQLVVYEPSSGERLGQPLPVAKVTIDPPEQVVSLEALTIPNMISTQASGRQARQVIPVGFALPQAIQPGQEMWLWLYWQAGSVPVANAVLRVSLEDEAESYVTDFDLAVSVGPLDSWRRGQVRRAVYHLPTSPRLTGSSALVNIALVSDQTVQEITRLAPVALTSRSRQYEVPPISKPVDWTLGSVNQVKLIGFDVPAVTTAGQPLPVTLYWQAATELDVNYTVFLQLLNGAGQIVAQVDLQPQAGTAPTTTWLTGEILVDPYNLSLPPDLNPGKYRLITGLYDATTGQRLKAATGVDFVELGEITIQ
jgi:4-amino-4-deoxy-L-arabinose transferase-like glycosyltransferase